MQSLLRLAFPPQCISCSDLVEREFGLCGQCYRDTAFIAGLVCEVCGVPLPGQVSTAVEKCDDCMSIARPWSRGRAALVYKDNARRLVLAFKHGDRLELAKPLANWMVGAGRELFASDSVLVPIPVHQIRLLQRRYNQAAILAKAIATTQNIDVIPDLLYRTRRTRPHDGMSREERFSNMENAIKPTKGAADILNGRAVVLVDDVITSGATMAAAADACISIGARRVDVLSLARVAKDA